MIFVRILTIAVLLSSSSLLCAQEKTTETPPTPIVESSQKTSTALHTLYMIKDPETGQMRQMTHEELKAQHRHLHFSGNTENMTAYVRADGGISQANEGRCFHMAMRKFDAEGNKVGFGCFNSLSAIDQFMKKPATKKKGERNVKNM